MIPERAPGAALRLFCLPYAGGSAVVFRGWGRALGPTVEVCAVELPGRGMRLREAPLVQLDALVEDVVRAMGPHRDKPFAIFGHSMGGHLAHEVARRLAAGSGPQPVRLLLSAAAPPHTPRGRPLHRLSDADLVARLRSFNGTPLAVAENAELMAFLLPMLRADFQAFETYAAAEAPPLACPFTVLGGIDDHLVDPRLLDGWSRYTRAECRVEMLPGDHFFLTSRRALLLSVLATELSRDGHAPPQGPPPVWLRP